MSEIICDVVAKNQVLYSGSLYSAPKVNWVSWLTTSLSSPL